MVVCWLLFGFFIIFVGDSCVMFLGDLHESVFLFHCPESAALLTRSGCKLEKVYASFRCILDFVLISCF